MPRKVPPGVERWRDRHGKIRTYGRLHRKGPRIRLPDINSEEFKLAYAKLLAGELAAAPERGPPGPGQ